MPYKMFLDDIRVVEQVPALKGTIFDIICRDYDAAIATMNDYGCPEFISFDHDLGLLSLNGYELAWWIVERDLDLNSKFIPDNFSFHVHSANPVGADNIRNLLNNYLKDKRENP